MISYWDPDMINSDFIWRIPGLPPPETKDICVEHDIEIPMPDGVILLADRYYPRGGEDRPLILIRSPYGRRGLNEFNSRLLAGYGFQVLIQSCRGTFGSGGKFDPFRQERADGLATVNWMKKQEWFPGIFGTFGSSYLGYVQWAIAKDAGPELKAMVVMFSCSILGLHHYQGGSFTLEDALLWTYLNFTENRLLFELPPEKMLEMPPRPPPEVERALNSLPLRDLDKIACGREIEFWQNLLKYTPDDEYWKPADHSRAVAEVKANVLLIGGWYDIFLPWQIKDYITLCEAGNKPHLIVGPWTHVAIDPIILREAVAWLRYHLLGDQQCKPRSPVRLFVMGVDEWRDYPGWPLPEYQPMRWCLQPRGGLAPELPPESPPDRYRYDPRDPTPTIGGPRLVDAGPRDNRPLESRPDVLTYTSPPLKEELEVIGGVKAELYAKSSLKCTDFFVRICDLHPSGESINICDGIISVKPGRPPLEEGGFIHVVFELWPTAYKFRRGHCIRVQVSSGAHPRYARNTGSCEPLSTASKLFVAENEIYHDPRHPSAVILPARFLK
ncbi:MAG: CocE/NonD family hydrolase [Candidatus Bathyarchaeia archaeon]